MRRLTKATVAACLASILLLAGCAGGAKDAATPSPSATASAPAAAEPTEADVKALDAVTMTGKAGAEPTVAFKSPFTVSAPVARVVAKGTGLTLVKGQVLSLNYIAVSGADGKTQGSTYKGEPDHITLGDKAFMPVLNDVLDGQKVGTRFLLAIPGDKDTTVMAVEVLGAKMAPKVPKRASGKAVVPKAGLPTVKLAKDGTPTITPVKGTPPTSLVVQPLIKGDGAKVTSGQTVTFQYAGALWNGKPFQSTWGAAAFTTAIGTGAVLKGWDQGIVGQTVGSQVLLVIPPSLGYGAKAANGIPANSTLIFVIDILAAS
ncbi:FKBP-type peptidyl-prolyl cis-trans isomerase [Pengzhenrongella sp.]|uniref:FKBP-type peptidyl-prolyl cis-trans isomerase n=1 Tax=Pengzhenrongella sp. TaxID=2888820 RepID=UPI002F92CF12